MGLFNSTPKADTIEEEKDVVPGEGGGMPQSDIYTAEVDAAYVIESKGGALGLSLVLKLEDGRFVRKQGMSNSIWMTNKNKETHYVKEGVARPLPGFSIANSLALLTTEEDFEDLADQIEERTIKVYDPGEGKEVPTEVQMVLPLIKQKVRVALLQKDVDKTALNEKNNKYEPTGESRTVVDIVKFLYEDDRTVTEIRGKVDDPEFANDFLKKWKGKVKDETTKSSGNKAKSSAKSGDEESAPKKKKSLFN